MKSYKSQISSIVSSFGKGKLPGLGAQLKMAPITRLADIVSSMSSEESNTNKGNIPRESAVLLLLYPKSESVYLVMMVRAADNTVHSGQVSFPGGKVEANDQNYSFTALRETYEEIGVAPDSIEIIGELSKLYIPPSNFDVYPFVGITKTHPKFTTNNEVEKLLEIKLSTFLDSKTYGYKTIENKSGNEFVVPCFNVHGEVLWGASAMILSEFLELIKGEFSRKFES